MMVNETRWWSESGNCTTERSETEQFSVKTRAKGVPLSHHLPPESKLGAPRDGLSDLQHSMTRSYFPKVALI